MAPLTKMLWGSAIVTSVAGLAFGLAPTPGEDDTAAILGVVYLGYVPVVFLLVAAVGAGVHVGTAHLRHAR